MKSQTEKPQTNHKSKPAPDGAKFAQANAICARFGFSRVTLWRFATTDPEFPKPRRYGSRMTLYDVHAVEQFLIAKGNSTNDVEQGK